MEIVEAIEQRHSVRAFTDQAVSEAIIKKILATASQAPSGVNSQPWQVAVVTGDSKQRITHALCDAFDQGIEAKRDFDYYPSKWIEPYKSRRFDCGMVLYAALGIKRDDKAQRLKVWRDNYHFFGAPAGLFLMIDTHLTKGAWFDSGLFFQSVMLAARGYGLETCPQASLVDYPDIVRDILGIDNKVALISGLALGYPDPSKPINQYRTDRAAVDEFTTWHQ